MPSATPVCSAAAAIRTGAILVAALALGVISFAIVAVFLRLSGSAPTAPPGQPRPALQFRIPAAFDIEGILLLVAFALMVMGLVVPSIVRAGMIRPIRARADRGESINEADLAQPFMTSTIIRAAMLEGPALLAVVVTFLEGNAFGLVIAAVAILLMLALALPTRAKFDNFVRDATGRLPAT